MTLDDVEKRLAAVEASNKALEASMHASASPSCEWGMCWELGCQVDADCALLDGMTARCGLALDGGICGWDCFSDDDCPKSLGTALRCSLDLVVAPGDPGTCVVSDAVCERTS